MTDTYNGSRYMLLRAEIEADERALLEKRRKAEATRIEEREAAIREIRLTIASLGLQPKDLFPTLSTARERRGMAPAKFAYQGDKWSGKGPKPQWFTDALAAGVTEEQMLIKRPEAA